MGLTHTVCGHAHVRPYSGHARLTDFGLASVVRGLHSVNLTPVQGYTQRWAAPEVIKTGDKNTREADVFSFAMVVIEVGHQAFPAPATGRRQMNGLPDI